MEILLSQNLFQNNQEMGYLYPHFKSAHWQLKRSRCPSGRPAGRPANGQIFDRWALRSTAWSTVPSPESNGSPPGRPDWFTESRHSVRSTDPIDWPGRPGPFPESRTLWTVDRPGRPAISPKLACTLVYVGQPTTAAVDRSGRPAVSQSANLGLKNLGIYLL